MPALDRDIRFVSDQSSLDDLCAAIAEQATIPVDTEFNRTRTFRPQLCLIQTATESTIYCIDVLVPLKLDQLLQTLSRGDGLKLFHAAKQDLEALYLTCQCLPQPLLDTQIAAALLGHPPQIGYAALVADLLGIRLDKSATRTDWSGRPLRPEQLAYAAEDVAHLPALYDNLRAGLEATGRWAWAIEDSATLVDATLYETPTADAWQRLAGVPYLPVPVQARARRLAAWREERAMRVDRPRQWIMSDKALLKIAHENPAEEQALRQITELPPAVARKQGARILAALRTADDEVAQGAVTFTRKSRPVATDSVVTKRLASLVDRAAEALGIAPELLATRRELTRLAQGHTGGRVMRGWRREVIGDALLEAL